MMLSSRVGTNDRTIFIVLAANGSVNAIGLGRDPPASTSDFLTADEIDPVVAAHA